VREKRQTAKVAEQTQMCQAKSTEKKAIKWFVERR